MDQQSPFSLTEYYKGRPLARLLDGCICALVCLLILWVPLPFGSVEYGSRAVIEGCALLCFFLWIYKLLYAGKPDELHLFRERQRQEEEMLESGPFFFRHSELARCMRLLTLGRWPRKNTASNLVEEQDAESGGRPQRFHSVAGYPVRNTGLEFLAILYFALLCVQLIPLPAFLVRILSPAAWDLYATASRATEVSYAFIPLSLDPFATFARLLEHLAYFMIFLTVVNNIRTRALFWIILYTIFAAAVFQGVYGLYELLSGSHHIFGYQKKLGLDSASGTFINRNHFAAYLELSLPLLIALVVGRVHQLRAFRGNPLVRLAHALETEGSQILILMFMIVLVAVSLIFSLSRSGISFCLVSVMTFLYFYWRSRHELSRKAYLALGICGTVALTVWIGLNPVLQRFLRVSENWAEGARWQVWTDTFRIFLHFPLTGTGAGTFSQIFPMYRSFVYNNVYREAHNDYVQFLAETGLVFAFLLLSAGQVLVSRIRAVLQRDQGRLEIIQLAAFCSVLSIALHSLTDFSLQIPAIALQGAIIVGLFFSHYHAGHRGQHT